MSVKLEKLDNVKFLLNYRNQNNTYLKVITSCLCSFSLLSTLLRLLLSAVIVQWKHHIMMTIQHSSPALLPVVRVAWNQLWGKYRHHRDSTLYEHTLWTLTVMFSSEGTKVLIFWWKSSSDQKSLHNFQPLPLSLPWLRLSWFNTTVRCPATLLYFWSLPSTDWYSLNPNQSYVFDGAL